MDDRLYGDFIVPDDDMYDENLTTIICAHCGSEMSTFDDKCYNCGMIIDEMDDSDYDI
jgi:DNA-directed RNA polymerase subunit RPC12/RpoP